MGSVERKVTLTESMAVSPCPHCNAEVSVRDCGYSTFNPGTAECKGCKRKWELGFVNDQWEAATLWNELQPKAVRVEQLETELKQLRGQ